MIPILFESNETSFTSNGLCRLRDIAECRVFEERNGVYECNFSYPIDGANFDKIKPGRIIGVTHNAVTVPRYIRYRGPITDEEKDNITDENDLALTGTGTLEVTGHDIQPFDIISYSRPINGIVEFHAVHISYRQSKMVSYASGINSLADAFQAFDDTCYPSNNPFTYYTDMEPTGYVAAFDGTPKTIRSLLGGAEGSILDAYGGEYEWDKWAVKLHSARGTQRDFTIRYGVNLTDFQDDTDYSESFNTCVPFWTSSDGVTVIGNEVSSGQGIIGNGDKCVPLDLTDRFEDQPSIADLESMAASIMASNKSYLPLQNIKVDFIQLQDEAGFDQFDKLLDCKLCDSVKVVFPGYGMSAYFKIVKTTWNVLLDRYDSMELGNLSTTLAEALGITDSGVSKDTSASISSDVLEFGNFRVCVMSQLVGYGAWADFTYPAGTFSNVLGVVPFCNQLGFGGTSSISITNVSSSKCTVYNYNSASASMQIGILAFGIK